MSVGGFSYRMPKLFYYYCSICMTSRIVCRIAFSRTRDKSFGNCSIAVGRVYCSERSSSLQIKEEKLKKSDIYHLFQKQMKKSLFIGWVLGGVTLVLAGCNTTKVAEADPALQAFAQCLTDNGLAMYGTERCPHCQNQKKLFWKAFESINYVDCDANQQKCQVAGVTGYPTWVAGDGEKLVGEQTFESLGTKAGCQVPAA